ncbi:MAG: hypothetical protein ABL971_01345 [Vicinamibacterales bacterium]
MSETPPAPSWLARLGRRLRPLFNPDADRERARFDAFVHEQREATSALQHRGAAQADRLTEVFREVQQIHKLHTGLRSSVTRELQYSEKVLRRVSERSVENGEDLPAVSAAQRRATSQSERLGEVFRDVESLRRLQAGLRARVTRELQFNDRVLRRVSERSVEIGEERVLARLGRLANGRGPVLVGPWAGEVGFELAYWIPFVRWALDHAGIDPARVTVLSRGGVRSWYDGLGHTYAEVLDYTTPEEFRERTAVSRKQRGLTAFDRTLLQRVQRGTATAYGLIHPAMMYALFFSYWRRDAPLARVTAYAHFRRHAAPPLGALEGRLPARYTAVRFYFSDCFPDTEANRRFAVRTVDRLAEQGDVVVLRAGGALDDHSDMTAATRQRVHVVDAGQSLRDNLEVQSAVIARACGFVGTYGGFSYLAPLYGVDAAAFYSHRTFQATHLHAAQHMLQEVQGGALVPLDVAQESLLASIFGRPAEAPERR